MKRHFSGNTLIKPPARSSGSSPRFAGYRLFRKPSTDDPLIEAVQFVKAASRRASRSDCHAGNRYIPIRWVPERRDATFIRRTNTTASGLLPDRYEFLLYRHLHNGLEAGDIFCRDSMRFRSMEDDLVDHKQWQNKERMIAEAGLRYPPAACSRSTSPNLKEQLETRIAEVNGESPPVRMSTLSS